MNQYGNSPLITGFSHDITGVSLWVKHPTTGQNLRVFTVEPEYAREIAQNLTLQSFKVEELRKSTGG